MTKHRTAQMGLAVTIVGLVMSLQMTTAAESEMSLADAWKFLNNFGYVDKSESDTKVGNAEDATGIDPDILREKLLAMQYMAGINQTGELDEETIKKMKTPRCSVSDTLGLGAPAKRRRRYVIEGSKWRKNSLTYGFSRLTQQFSADVQKQILAKALQYWAAVTPLSFKESSSPDIDILFASGDHGDGYPFDGRGGVLAHAFFPGSGGDAHFDNDEQWTDGVNYGTNLLQVAIHEFGHSLGLAHSNNANAIMYAYYLGYQANPQLTRDDISGIQYIYGAPTQGSSSTTTKSFTTTKSITTTQPRGGQPATKSLTTIGLTTKLYTTSLPKPSICSNPVVDAIICIDSITYAFSGENYYILNDYGIASGYPKKISSNWPGFSGTVDVAINYPAVTSTDRYGRTVIVTPGYLFLFQGSKYWKYENVNHLTSGYPRDINSGFPGLPDNLDAGFTWSGNGRIFFIKGNMYYRYSPGIGTDAGYPRPLSAWKGLPSSISAAFQWKNGMTYFFSGTSYYRFDDYNFQVASGYPRNTGEWWFGCSNGALSGDIQMGENADDRNQLQEIENSQDSSSASFIHMSSISILVTSFFVFLVGKYL